MRAKDSTAITITLPLALDGPSRRWPMQNIAGTSQPRSGKCFTRKREWKASASTQGKEGQRLGSQCRAAFRKIPDRAKRRRRAAESKKGRRPNSARGLVQEPADVSRELLRLRSRQRVCPASLLKAFIRLSKALHKRAKPLRASCWNANHSQWRSPMKHYKIVRKGLSLVASAVLCCARCFPEISASASPHSWRVDSFLCPR